MRALKLHRLCRCGLLVLLVARIAPAQSKPVPKADPDRLGKSCAQILSLTSSDWVAKFTEEKDATPDATVRAIHVYGQCYDARTDRLAASLAKSGRGPLMGARGNFRETEQAIKDFTSSALATGNPSGDAVKTAYAALYQKQFRYEFYLNYQKRNSRPATPGANKAAEADKLPASAQPESQPADAAQVSEMTKAKNRFGELLEALPEDKLREIHRAFGKIFAAGPVSDEMKLAIYRYAIFCLQSPSAAPFAPPPF
jgi:hypothetical protein